MTFTQVAFGKKIFEQNNYMKLIYIALKLPYLSSRDPKVL